MAFGLIGLIVSLTIFFLGLFVGLPSSTVPLLLVLFAPIYGPYVGAGIGLAFFQIRNCFSSRSVSDQPASPISDNARTVFSRFENNARAHESKQEPTQELNSTFTHNLVDARLSISRRNSNVLATEPLLQPGPRSAEPAPSFSPMSSSQSQYLLREKILKSEVDAEKARAVAAEKAQAASLR